MAVKLLTCIQLLFQNQHSQILPFYAWVGKYGSIEQHTPNISREFAAGKELREWNGNTFCPVVMLVCEVSENGCFLTS